ncbi:hypothetical protein [Roseovarius sp. 2305UL8-3]
MLDELLDVVGFADSPELSGLGNSLLSGKFAEEFGNFAHLR